MKTATVRELRGEFPRLLRWLQAGETVAISRKGNVVARLVLPESAPAAGFTLPDFTAQRREVFGAKAAGKPLPRSIVAEERDSYDR